MRISITACVPDPAGTGRARTLTNLIIRAAIVASIAMGGVGAARPAAAYSVLAHEADIDALWDSTMAPMLRALSRRDA